MTYGAEGGGVAFWAHVGGFVAGVPLILLFRDKAHLTQLRRSGRSRIPPVRRGRPGPWG